jgi:hypothetical protein
MTFYIGSNEELPIIHFDKNSPGFHAIELSEDEKAIYKHISKTNILYFGSDQGCGCGFRHALLHNGEWLIVEDEEASLEEDNQKNHQALHMYIKTYVQKGTVVEIYGCWDGDLAELSESTEELDTEDLLDKNLYFKERGFYIVKNGA